MYKDEGKEDVGILIIISESTVVRRGGKTPVVIQSLYDVGVLRIYYKKGTD